VALYGRKINQAEHQLAFIEMLRLITDGVIGPREAVHAYHGVLQAKGIKAHRSLDRDLQLTEQAMSYDERGSNRSKVFISQRAPTASQDGTVIPPSSASETEPAKKKDASDTGKSWPVHADGRPNFSQMTASQRRDYDRERLRKMFG
jgi:hypothetical protein